MNEDLAAAVGGLHVRLVTWDDDPPVGGQGVHVRELRRELMARGVTVTTTAGHGQFAVRYPNFTGHGPLDLSIALNRSIAPLLANRPDVVNVSGGPGGIQLLRHLPVPVVYTAHHTFRLSHPWYRLQRAYGLLEKSSYRRADAIIAVSPSTADSVVEMGIERSKVIVISPGIRVEAFDNLEVEREPGRVLFVGRLHEKKGPLDAVEAMRLVIEQVPGVRGFVVGSGPIADSVRRAADSVPDGAVTFLGALSDEDVVEQFRRAEVVLVPSAFEGLGLVPLEAMAAGTAVVGYDVVGLHDTVGRRGELVAHGDVAALAAACRRLLVDSTRREQLVEAAREAVRKERSWSRCAEETEHVYRSVRSAR